MFGVSTGGIMILRPNMRQARIIGIGAVSALGEDLRLALQTKRHCPTVTERVADLIPAHLKTKRLMSDSAQFAALAAHRALLQSGSMLARQQCGYFLGAGASGDIGDDVASVVAASLENGRYSDAAFGKHGLRTMHPQKTFLLLTNFTMCHSAMLEKTCGPNAVFFSRGSGTVMGLWQAISALTDLSCLTALAGGADCAHSAMTHLELARDGWIDRGLLPGQGAGMLLLSRSDAHLPTLAVVDAVAIANRRYTEAIPDELTALANGCDYIIAVTATPAIMMTVTALAAQVAATMIDLSATLGDSLAAAPALGWVLAVQLIADRSAGTVVVISHGIDETWCAVRFSREMQS
jgi:3-oxoacyl-(acyl-carrier-protein) synthase